MKNDVALVTNVSRYRCSTVIDVAKVVATQAR